MTQAAKLAALGSAGVATGFKNRIINGAMMIDQRNAGAAITATGYSVDRWQYAASVASKASVAQSTTVPSGFINSISVTSSSAYTVGSGEVFVLRQTVEGLNIADLGWGSASAATVTLSFVVRSSLTGTFGGALLNGAENRSYPFSFTISSANTWETKQITIAGDTSGTWLTTNGAGIKVTFGLGVGSTLSGAAGSWSGSTYYSATGATSVVGTNGATFYITGVQLEVGTTATTFDFRSYGTELALCQRYYQKSCSQTAVPTNGANTFTSTVSCHGTSNGYSPNIRFQVTMRAAPTIPSNQWQSFNGTSWLAWTTTLPAGIADCGFFMDLSGGFSSTQGYSYLLRGDWTASAEL